MKTPMNPDLHKEDALVWDLPIRIFHWSLVGLVTLALGGAYFAPESWLTLHVIAGYGIGILVTFRVIWGIWGGHYSRFATFPLSFDRLLGHFRHLFAGRSPTSSGHTPMGAWMIITLLATLGVMVASGLIMLGGQENQGPLAFLVGYKMGKIAEEAHEVAAILLMIAIALHVVGVLVERFVFHHPLIAAMFTGRKPGLTLGEAANGLLAGRGLLLLATVALVLVIPAAAMTAVPASGWHSVSENTAYQKACSECHHAHHPSLRTATDWRTIVDGLSDHYGEDASITAATSAEITRWLEANAAETFDTEASNRLGRAQSQNKRITETRFWKRRHHDIAPAVFRTRPVGSAVNCNACHEDAVTGRFDDQAIALPKGEPK